MRIGSPANPGVPDTSDGYDSATAVRVLWIGNPSLVLEFAATRPSELHITACECGALGRYLEAAREGHVPWVDGVVVDATEDGIDALAAVDVVDAAAPELAVVLLVAERPASAPSGGAEPTVCDRVVKTQGFLHQVVPTLAQGRARLDLLAVFRATSEREARLRSILDLQPAVAVLVDDAGRMTAVNRAGLQLLGDESGSEVVGKRFLDFVPADERAAVAVLFSGGPLVWAEHPLLRTDGTLLHVRTRVTPFVHRDGAVSLVTIDDRSTLQHVVESDHRSGVAGLQDEEDDEGWEDVFGEAAGEAPLAADPAPAPATGDAAAAAADREHERLVAELDDLRARHQALGTSAGAEQAALTRHAVQVQAQYALLEVERQRLESALAETQLQAGVTASRLSAVEADRLELRSALGEATSRLVSLSGTVERMDAAATAAAADSHAAAEERGRLEQERARSAAALREALEEVEASARRAAETEAVAAEAQGLAAKLESARTALEAAAAERAALSEAWKTDTEHQATMLRDALADLQGLAAECDRTDRALRSAGIDRRIQEAALATSIRERERLSGALSEATHEKDALSADLATRAETISRLEAQLAAATIEGRELAADRDRLATLLAQAGSDLEELTAERERATLALEDARLANQRLAAEHAQSSIALDAAERSMSELTRERIRIVDDRDRLSRALQAVVSNLHVHADSADGTAASAAPPVEESHDQALLPPAPAPEPVDDRDRRRHPRIDGSFDGERLGLMDTAVRIQNLSVGGCFVTSYYPPPSDPRFELRIDLDKHGVVVVDVETAYVSPEIGYGVSFVTVTEAARRRIEAAVDAGKAASRQRQHSARNTPAG